MTEVPDRQPAGIEAFLTIMAIEKSERDTRIDVLRALALLTIYIDHVPGTMFDRLTYKNWGFSDAAEAFVLISGIAIALAYGSKFKPGGRLVSTIKMLRRAAVLYASHIVVTVATLGIFCAGAIFWQRPDLLMQINIEPVVDKTPEAIVGIFTLGHQLGYNNILPVYSVILLMTPFFLYLTTVNMRLALGVSGGLWLISGLFTIAPPNYPQAGYWFLNPLSWQFLFVIGMATMLHIKRGGSLPVNRWLVGAAAGYALLALFVVHSPLWGKVTWFGLPPVLGGFDKTFLSLPRLLHILSIAYLVVAVPAVSNFFRLSPDHPLAILGKRSLPVFIAGTLAAMAAQVLRNVHPTTLGFDIWLIATGILIQFTLAYYLEWISRIGASGKKPSAHLQPNRQILAPGQIALR